MTVDTSAWRGVTLDRPLEEGVRNTVWLGRMKTQPVAVRRTRRSLQSLEWELDLIDHLHALGFRVPRPIRTDDGTTHSRGVVVQEWIEGYQPQNQTDWMLVADQLQRLHDATRDFPQRPGCCPVTRLTHQRRSVDADIDQMPPPARERVLDILADLEGLPTSVVHGDPGPSNIRVTPQGEIALLDWDESRYDLSCLDLGSLGVQVLDEATHRRVVRALYAWEAANGWIAEPDYARRQLQLLDETI